MSKSYLGQKLQHKPQFVLRIVFFNFGRKKSENLILKNGHLGPFVVIFWHLHGYLSQKVNADCHSEGLNMS